MEEQPNQKPLDQQQSNENNSAVQQQPPLRVDQQQQQQQQPLLVDQQQNNDNDNGNGGIIDERLRLEIFNNFPPGYRFNPHDEELIIYYLNPKINGQPLPLNLMFDVNIYQDHPRVITASYPAQEGNWYFFTPREKIYPHGCRPRRQAGDGRWKPIGSTTDIYIYGEKIGGKRFLEYEEKQKKAHNSVKENWGMREYWIEESSEILEMRKNSATIKLDRVLSIIYKKANKAIAPKKKGKEQSSEKSQPKPKPKEDDSRKRIGKEKMQESCSETEATNEAPRKRKEIVLGGSGPRVHHTPIKEEVVPFFCYGPAVDNDVLFEFPEPKLLLPPSTITTMEYFNPNNNFLLPSSTTYEYGGTGLDGNTADYSNMNDDLTTRENGGISSTQSTHYNATNNLDDGNDFQRWTDLHHHENDFIKWTNLHWK